MPGGITRKFDEEARVRGEDTAPRRRGYTTEKGLKSRAVGDAQSRL